VVRFLSLPPDVNDPGQPAASPPPGAGLHDPVSGLTVQAASWFPDGNRVLFAANEAGHGIRIYVLELASQKSRAVTPEGYRLAANSAAVSPDGKLVVVRGPDRKSYLYPLEGGEPTALTLDPKWIPTSWVDGSASLLVRTRGEVPVQVQRFDLRSGSLSPWRSFMPADSTGVTTIGAVRVTSDGKAYAYSYARNLSDLYVVEGLE